MVSAQSVYNRVLLSRSTTIRLPCRLPALCTGSRYGSLQLRLLHANICSQFPNGLIVMSNFVWALCIVACAAGKGAFAF